MSDNSMLEGLKGQAVDFAKALGRRAVAKVGEKVEGIADKFEASGDAEGEAAKAGAKAMAEGKSPAKAATSAATTGAKEKVKEAFGGGSSGGGSGGNKFINIVESAEVGVPLSVAYNAFTQFEDWPDFMKKVENVERTDDTKIEIKGQVFWSHRTFEATITEQVADSHVVWESTGNKGYISGGVSFHEVAPRLTRIVVVGEYHPKGFVERVGNIWRALGRRFRLELKFFVHHVMTDTILDQDGVEGWRGEIRDGEVVTSHEDALQEESEAAENEDDDQNGGSAAGGEGEPEDGADDEQSDDGDYEESSEDDEDADEYEEDQEPADDADEVGDEYEDEAEPAEDEESTEDETVRA